MTAASVGRPGQRNRPAIECCGRAGRLSLAVALAGLLLSSAPPRTWAADRQRPRRLIYNSDGGNVFIDKMPPMGPADVNSYVDEVAGTGVTTFFICPNYGMALMYPSRITEMLGSHLSPEEAARNREIALTSKGSTERAVANLHALVEAGHDPIGLVVERAREKGLEVFITFRLNEIHDVHEPASLLLSRFWREHPEWRVGAPGDEVGKLFQEIIGPNVSPVVRSWFPGALNFAVPEVRRLRLAELEECCQRYPIDGIDLDFQRFPIYFPQGQGRAHLETMTAWMREVRQMTRQVGRQRGRPLAVSVRVLARPRQCLEVGLDPAGWAGEDLVDMVTVSHYLRNDFPLPVAEFRALLPDMPLYASIEVDPEPETYRRIARELWAAGADGILLFNFFTTREGNKEPPFELLHELGDPAQLGLERN